LTIAIKSVVERDLRVAAWEGSVDQTSEANPFGRGRRAQGPVGRKRWYAVERLYEEVESGPTLRVATTP